MIQICFSSVCKITALNTFANNRTLNAGLGWPTTLKVFKGIASGLEHIHGVELPRIIHCDIKPDNILLDSVSSSILFLQDKRTCTFFFFSYGMIFYLMFLKIGYEPDHK